MFTELITIKQFITSFLFTQKTLAIMISLLGGFLVSYFILRSFSKKDNPGTLNKLIKENFIKLRNFPWQEIFVVEPWPTLKINQPTKLEYFWGWLYLPFRINYIKHLKIVLSAIFLMTLLIALIYNDSSVIYLFIFISFIDAIYLWNRFHKMRRKFIDQIPDCLTRLIEAIQSGYSLPQAIAFISHELQTPLKDIFSVLDRALEFGIPLEEAMSRTEEQINMGGNIIPFLEEIVIMQREKLALQREIQKLTASSRATGYLLAGLVPAIVIILTLISPDYFSIFFKTSTGLNLLILAIILEIVGFLWIHRILRINY